MLGGAVALHLRIGQRELDVVAAIDRQIVDAALADGVGGGAARGFNVLGFGADFDDFLAARYGERDGQLGHPADGDGDAGGFGPGETRRFHGNGIRAGSQLTHTVAALAVAAAGALQALGGIARGDRGVGYGVAFWISYADVEVAGGSGLGKCRLTDEQEDDRNKEQTK